MIGGVGMSAKAGDRIEIESETVGTPTREGEILEVMQGELSVRYRIRWHDEIGRASCRERVSSVV